MTVDCHTGETPFLFWHPDSGHTQSLSDTQDSGHNIIEMERLDEGKRQTGLMEYYVLILL